MRRLVPQLIEALEAEVAAVGRRRGVRELHLHAPEPRDPSSLTRSGVSAVWFRTAQPDFVLDSEGAVGTLRVGAAGFEVQVVTSEPGRLLLSIEHPKGPLPPLGAVTLVLDPTELLKRLRDRLSDALTGDVALNWALLDRVEGRSEAVVAKAEAELCRLEGLSAEQSEAVQLALGSDVLFIQGPPGTGKTKTIAHIVASALELGRSILVASHTHVAVDQALLALVGRDGPVRRDEPIRERIVRVGEPRLIGIPDALVLPTLRDDEHADRLGAADAVFATLSKVYMDQRMLARRYDVVLIDEVSMVSAALAIPTLGLARRSVVLVGDPHQLPPIVNSRDRDAKRILGRDLFDLCGASRRPCFVRITLQRRMRPEIAELARELRYGYEEFRDHDSVRSRPTVLDREGATGADPLVVVRLRAREGNLWRDGTSYWNLASGVAAVELVRAMAPRFPRPEAGEPKPIGLIVPYSTQRRVVLRLLDAAGVMDWVLAGTVHTFQGNEAAAVVIDPVLARPARRARLLTQGPGDELGREANVAVTRARDQLTVIAEPIWWRDFRFSAYGIVVERIRARGSVRDWAPMADGTKRWIPHRSMLAAARSPIPAESVAFLAGDGELVSAWSDVLQTWFESGVRVLVATDDRRGRPDGLPQGVTWVPWRKPPEMVITDHGVVIAPDRAEAVEVRSTSVADLVGGLVRLRSLAEHFAASPRCEVCGGRQHVEVTLQQGDEPIVATCASSRCATVVPMVYRGGSLGPRKASARRRRPGSQTGKRPLREVEPSGLRPGRRVEPSRPTELVDAGPVDDPRAVKLSDLVPAHPQGVRTRRGVAWRVDGEYFVAAGVTERPRRFGRSAIEKAWSRWVEAGCPSDPMVLRPIAPSRDDRGNVRSFERAQLVLALFTGLVGGELARRRLAGSAPTSTDRPRDDGVPVRDDRPRCRTCGKVLLGTVCAGLNPARHAGRFVTQDVARRAQRLHFTMAEIREILERGVKTTEIVHTRGEAFEVDTWTLGRASVSKRRRDGLILRVVRFYRED